MPCNMQFCHLFQQHPRFFSSLVDDKKVSKPLLMASPALAFIVVQLS